jgi:curved DNA-binding protein CbpA
MSTHYEVLRVPTNANSDEIRASYRALAKTLHPDVNRAPDADDAFKALQKAYEVLMNRKARNEYDYAITFDEKMNKRVNSAIEQYGIDVYEPPKKKKEKREKPRKFRRADVDFEEIPPGFVNDRFDDPDRIGGVL